MSKNQRKSRLYCSCSQYCRSLRIECSAITSRLLSSRSGGTDGRPVSAYIASNTGDSPRSAWSASFFTSRSGCSRGIRDSGETRHNIED